MCIRITIGTFGKITVERSDNRVFADRIIGMAFPLSDARTASIRHNSSPNLLESINHPVTLGGGSNLFRTRIDNQRSSHSQMFFSYLTGNGSSPT